MVNFAYQNTEHYKRGVGLANHVLKHPQYVDIWAPLAVFASPLDEQRGFLETMDDNASEPLLERVVAYAEQAPSFETRTAEGCLAYILFFKQHFSKFVSSDNANSA